MNDTQVSLSALISTFTRGYHSEHGAPKIFDDFLANRFLTAEERAFFSQRLAEAAQFYDPEGVASCQDEASALACMMQTQSAPVLRGRYTEDCLENAEGMQQYVILGAGMDTYAFRHPKTGLQIFELDHPATQGFKRDRLESLGWESPRHLHFIPIDFNKEELQAALARSSYESTRKTFFSWLGVTYYLPYQEVKNTLRSLAQMAPSGSMVVFDYLDPDAFDPEKASPRMQRLHAIMRRTGEPFMTGINPALLIEELEDLGLRLVENLNASEIEFRYSGQGNSLVHDHMHFAQAIVR